MIAGIISVLALALSGADLPKGNTRIAVPSGGSGAALSAKVNEGHDFAAEMTRQTYGFAVDRHSLHGHLEDNRWSGTRVNLPKIVQHRFALERPSLKVFRLQDEGRAFVGDEIDRSSPRQFHYDSYVSGSRFADVLNTYLHQNAVDWRIIYGFSASDCDLCARRVEAGAGLSPEIRNALAGRERGIAREVGGEEGRYQGQQSQESRQGESPGLEENQPPHVFGGVRRTGLLDEIVLLEAMLFGCVVAALSLGQIFGTTGRRKPLWAALAAAGIVVGILCLKALLLGRVWLPWV